MKMAGPRAQLKKGEDEMTVEALLSRVRMVTAPEQGNVRQEAASAVAGIALTALLYSQTSKWITGRRLASMPLRIAAMTLPPAVTLAAREVANRGMAAFEARFGKGDPAEEKRSGREMFGDLQALGDTFGKWVATRPEIEDEGKRQAWEDFKGGWTSLEGQLSSLTFPTDRFFSRGTGFDDLLNSRTDDRTTDA
jgi:hypothetical protein